MGVTAAAIAAAVAIAPPTAPAEAASARPDAAVAAEAVRAEPVAATGRPAARGRRPSAKPAPAAGAGRRRGRGRARCARSFAVGRRLPGPERLVDLAPPRLPGASAPPATGPGLGAPARPRPGARAPSCPWPPVTLRSPSRARAVAAGRVTVELRNVGEDPHDLVIGPDDGTHTPLDQGSRDGSRAHPRKR